jgi:site-specific DNA recombinase
MTNGKVTCVNRFVGQSDLESGFVRAYNMLMSRKEDLIPRWKKAIETGNALEKLRAKQFMELSEQPELECYVPELAQLVIQKVIVKGAKKYEFTFMDGSREMVSV